MKWKIERRYDLPSNPYTFMASDGINEVVCIVRGDASMAEFKRQVIAWANEAESLKGYNG